MSYVPTHWDERGLLPHQGVQQTDRTKTVEGDGWDMVVPPAGRGGGRGSTIGGGDLHLPTLEQNHIVHCD